MLLVRKGSGVSAHLLFVSRYEQMRDIQASLSGIKIARVGDGVLEVLVLQQHSLRLHFERDSMALERVEVSSLLGQHG